MVDTPFQQPQDLTVRQNRVLALAGVFQAAQLTHITAMTGLNRSHENDSFYLEQLIKSSLCIRPLNTVPESSLNTLNFFNGFNDLMLGLKHLESSLSRPFSIHPKSHIPKLPTAKLSTSYAISLLHLEKKIYQNEKFVEVIELAQQKILKQFSFFDHNYSHPSVIAHLAQAYLETAGQIQPRILVRGHPEAFKDSQHTDKIRASLFTGLQMAHLWRQMGGRSRQLIFSKRKITKDIHSIARIQHQLIEK